MRTWSSCSSAALLAALLLSPAARGDAFQRDYQGGIASYKQERYAEAIARFQRAYERRPLPRLLINIGRAHLRLGDAQRALVYFNRYLEAERSPDPFVKDEVERDIARAFAMLSIQKEPEATALAPPAPVTAPATAAPAPVAAVAASAPVSGTATAQASAPLPWPDAASPAGAAAPPAPTPRAAPRPWTAAPASAPAYALARPPAPRGEAGRAPPEASPPPPPQAAPPGPQPASVAFLGRDPRMRYTVSAAGQICETPCSLLLPPGPTHLMASGGGPPFQRTLELPAAPAVVQLQHFTRSRVVAGAVLLALAVPLGVGAGLALSPAYAPLTPLDGSLRVTSYAPTTSGIVIGSVLGAHALSFLIAGAAQLATIRRARIELLAAP